MKQEKLKKFFKLLKKTKKEINDLRVYYKNGLYVVNITSKNFTNIYIYNKKEKLINLRTINFNNKTNTTIEEDKRILKIVDMIIKEENKLINRIKRRF